MWRAERRDPSDDILSDADDIHARVEHQVTGPHVLPLGDPSVRLGNIAAPVWQEWRADLAAVGGRSPLLHFVDAPRTRIELSATHPGGLARFITGKTTLLSSLIRDDLALRSARIAAGEIATKGVELTTARGIDAVHLGIGIAEWQFEGEQFRSPILLRPLAIRRYGRDFELRLRDQAALNPELQRVLREQFAIELDAASFAALAESDGSFKPNPVIDRLRGLTSHLDWFNVQPRLVVSSFADVSTRLVADAAELAHPVLDALAGNSSARAKLESSYRRADPPHQDRREPSTDTLLLDADAEQENVVAQIAAGNSIVVKTLPGTGGTQTIVNAIGALAGQNKRVLVVSPRRSSLTGIRNRLAEQGLAGFAVSPASLRRDLIRSITRNERAVEPKVGEVDGALVRLRKVLLDYRTAIARIDPDLRVSVLDALTELSALALQDPPPSTTVRLPRSSVEALADSRDAAADALAHAATLGEFKYGPGDSPWYGADFATSDGAAAAHELAKRLHRTDLPRLLSRAGHVLGATHMRPFENITQLGAYLRLLIEIRDTLDRFSPAVFDRPLNELIAATAPRREHPEMSGASRRRLKRLAKEYVRPGVHVGDLHDSLVRIQQQRLLWQRYVAAGAVPEIPIGVADLQVAYQQVEQDLASLDRPLGTTLTSEQLVSLPVPQLGAKLGMLAAESDVLNNLQERAEIRQMLRSLQLDALLADLSSRHVPAEAVGAELELAWWQSALEALLEQDTALLRANTSVLDRLEADFRLVDEAHVGVSPQLLSWQLADSWKIGLVDWPDEAVALKSALLRQAVTSDILQDVAPHLSRLVAPVWLASPYEVDRITDRMPFDTVILVDAGAMTLPESAAAVRRAAQVVAFGDPVTQTPAPFRIAVADEYEQPGPGASQHQLDDLHENSALARLSTLVPTLSLTRSYRAGGEDLAELVNRRFYGGRIDSLPWAGSFLGHPSLRLDFVPDGSGLPDAQTGAVESVDAEVARVVDLVLEHAATRPGESLMVITPSAKHVVRVQQAVLTAVATRPEFNEFILGDHAEPFTVMTIDQAVAESRDRVILSIGYGRTPHGRVLSDFGALGAPGGERLLAVAMTRARRSMVIVACFEPQDIDQSRIRFGASALVDILTDIAARAQERPNTDVGDPMLVDLAHRLRARGLRVTLGHRGKLGLVTSKGGMCLTVETDTNLGGGEPHTSLREALRLRPEVLRRLGWHYLRVHAFELFSDPDAVADKIAVMLGVPSMLATQPIAVIDTVSHAHAGA